MRLSPTPSLSCAIFKVSERLSESWEDFGGQRIVTFLSFTFQNKFLRGSELKRENQPELIHQKALLWVASAPGLAPPEKTLSTSQLLTKFEWERMIRTTSVHSSKLSLLEKQADLLRRYEGECKNQKWNQSASKVEIARIFIISRASLAIILFLFLVPNPW